MPGLDDAIQRVVAATLASGRRHGGDGLRYAWHGKEYVGAAHGYAGILYLLLKAGCRDPALRALADWLRDLETREGNWPSSLPDARAKLVHFCHGAPGVVFAMAEAHRVYGDESFRDACLRGAETVWHYRSPHQGPWALPRRRGQWVCAARGVSSLARPDVVAPRRRFWDVYRRRRRLRPAADAGQPVSLFEGLARGFFAAVS